MTVARYFRHRGHRINVDTRSYATTYEDGVPLGAEERPCSACGRCALSVKAPDPCIGYLPGVLAACCGHGLVHSAYVHRSAGGVLTGEHATSWMIGMGGEPAALGPDGDPTIREQLSLRTMTWLGQLHHDALRGYGDKLVAATKAMRSIGEKLR